MSLGAHAAVSVTTITEPQPPSAGAATRSLDKALGGGLSTGDHNLDLLLDAQRKGTDRLDEKLAGRSLPERPASGRLAITSLPEPSRSMAPMATMPAVIPPLAVPGQILQAAPPGAQAQIARGWGVGTAQAAAGTRHAGAGASAEAGGLRADHRLREWVLEGLAFVKHHLFTILAAGAMIALLVVGLKTYSRRV